jgi:hypothetical protein
MPDEFTKPGELVVLIALADAEIEPTPGGRSRVTGCSANSTGLCRGSTMTAVASRKQRVRAKPGQQVERRRDLAIAGTVMLDDKGAVKAERLGVDDILDEIAKSLTAVEFGAAAPLPKGPNCIAPISFQRSISLLRVTRATISPNPYLDYPHFTAA